MVISYINSEPGATCLSITKGSISNEGPLVVAKASPQLAKTKIKATTITRQKLVLTANSSRQPIPLLLRHKQACDLLAAELPDNLSAFIQVRL
jgi:hypothetical protein